MNMIRLMDDFKKNGSMLWAEAGTIKLFVSEAFKSDELKKTIVSLKPEILGFLAFNKVFSKQDFIDRKIFNTDSERAPLSFAQERLWFLDQYEGGMSAYHIPGLYEVPENVGEEAVRHALNCLVERHGVLRSTISQEDGVGLQLLHSRPIEVPVGAFSDTATCMAAVADEISRPFNLASEYPVRAKLYKIGQEKTLLLVNTHHIASDGWSMGVMVRELGEYLKAYAAGDKGFKLPPLDIQYKDYALWQREYLTGETIQGQSEYWSKKLTGFQTLNLPADFMRPAKVSYEGEAFELELDEDTSFRAAAFARRTGITTNSLFTAFATILLGRYAGQTDVVFGSPTANRHLEQTAGLIGFFANTQVNRYVLAADESFEAFALRVHEDQIGAQDYQDLPFEKIVDGLKIERDLSRHPVFQVMFSMIQETGGAGNGKGEFMQPFPTEGKPVAKFDLDIFVSDRGEKGYVTAFGYAKAIFREETIERMAHHFQNLISSLLENPKMPCSQAAILGNDERQRLLGQCEAPPLAHPGGGHLAVLFSERANLAPESPALTHGSLSFTYGELEAVSSRFAQYLRQLGATKDVLVGVNLERGAWGVVAVLGILKIGAAFVPIDPEYPADRASYIKTDSGVSLTITPETVSAFLEARDQLPAAMGPTESTEGLAYVIYTSGSTGQPKGVRVTHENVISLLKPGGCPPIAPGDALLANGSPSFDISVYEMFAPLLAGGRLVIADKADLLDLRTLGGLIESHAINIIHLIPALLNQIVDNCPEILTGISVLMTGGDKVSPRHVDRIMTAHPGLRVIHCYGPTESTVFASTHELTKSHENIPIGKPFPGRKMYVLDPAMNLCPYGVPGELFIGGQGVAAGYHGKAEETASRFLPDPFTRGKKLYRTGDLVKMLPTGDFVFLGRADDQIKIQGRRVEPGEVERALASLPGIALCCVVARDGVSGKYLAGYYVPQPDAPEGTKWVSDALLSMLPSYMVPSAFVALSGFPLTPNGKIDKKALPDTGLFTASEEYVAPVTDAEKSACEIWAAALGLGQVGVTDDFFKIGGNSILAVQAAFKMGKALGIEVRVADIFRLKTIRNILGSQGQNRGLVNLYAPSYRTGLPDLIFISPGHAGTETYQGLAEAVASGYNCIGIDNHNLHREDKISNLKELAERYWAEYAQNYAPQASIHLAGWSLGGQIALEMAWLLESKGHQHIHLTLFDTFVRDEKLREYSRRTSLEERSALIREEMLGKYEAEYVEKAVSSLAPEEELANAEISGRLRHTKTVLFKASPPADNDGFRAYLNTMKYNNIGSVADKLDVIHLNCGHYDILETKKSEIAAHLLSQIPRT